MYRLLIVDDEEIITDGLYEVFRRYMPEELDVCRAYSAQEALEWMSRTRIDIVLTDIAMPGMNGLDMTEKLLAYWPRCRVIFLSGHSEFEYAYRAIQWPNVRYLLKTEGYDKVQETVHEVMQELQRVNQEYRLLEQSREQACVLELIAQGDYMRQLLQDSRAFCADSQSLALDFNKLSIPMKPQGGVVLVLGRLAYPEGLTYSERSERSNAVRAIWDDYMSDQTIHLGIADRYGDLLWFVQPFNQADDPGSGRLLRYLEGTLELIQEACLASLELTVGFTVSGGYCAWDAVTAKYDRLRRLQQLKFGDGMSIIMDNQSEAAEGAAGREHTMLAIKAEQLASHLEAGRDAEFYGILADFASAVPDHDDRNSALRFAEAYYAAALVLYSSINRLGLHDRIEWVKLLRLDDHSSLRAGFDYLKQVAEAVFRSKHCDERDRASQAINRICQYVESHIDEDISLVKLAELHYFNPSYLSRLFKQERGMNLSEYIDRCRIVRAKSLLCNGELKIRDVSVAVGYGAAHSFTRFFKKMTGMTPQEYRDGLTGDR